MTGFLLGIALGLALAWCWWRVLMVVARRAFGQKMNEEARERFFSKMTLQQLRAFHESVTDELRRRTMV